MIIIKPLHYSLLRRKIKISSIPFMSTKEANAFPAFVGQERAREALLFGIEIKSQGYNLYAMGPTGTGKLSLINNVLKEAAKFAPTPPDWCYVHNFEVPEKPKAIKLPAGRGFLLQQDMKSFIKELGANILSIFESEEYRNKLTKIRWYYDSKRKAVKKVTLEDLTPKLYKQQYKKEQRLKRQVIHSIVKPVMTKFKRRYAKFKMVLKYLSNVQEDIINHLDDFINQDDKTNVFTFSLENPALIKYKVNLLVDNRKLKGAPIIFEPTPSYSTLISRIEYTTIEGNTATNFSLIKPGNLHSANGGFLILEARKLKKNRDAWEALKNALYSKKITIKPLQHENETFVPISLDPMPIPLNIKIILTGDRNIYYTLCQYDADFAELFKVPVDFNEQTTLNKKSIRSYAELIAKMIDENKLLAFNASAVAKIIEYSLRLEEDVDKLSLHISTIRNLVVEANYWAKKHKKNIVTGKDVTIAVEKKLARTDRSQILYYEDIKRNFIIIHTKGKLIGQVNGLSVRRVGDISYGHPTRITARVRIGKGKIIDIQREIKMAGPLHSKASLIISNFLASRFNYSQPFSLTASLSFEQIYCWTDGDSASVAELCALLSALADTPLFQHFAVTGSIDQYGQVQAIGGVNEKIEGFFDICKANGLNHAQGVLIPAVNVKNLMLREEIVTAAKQKKFFIYPVNTIDEAFALLTGYSTATAKKAGALSIETIYHKIEMRLQEFSKGSRKT